MGIREQVLERATQEGVEKGKTTVVKNLIKKIGLTDAQAAEIAEVPVAFVEKVRAMLGK